MASEKSKGKGSAVLFLIFALGLNIIDAYYRMFVGVPNHYVFIIPYFFLMLLAYFMLLTPRERSEEGRHYLLWFGIITLISIITPMANGFLQYHLEGLIGASVFSFVWILILISPAWMIYLGFWQGEKAKYTNFIGMIYFFIWATFAFIWFFPQIQAMSMQLDYRMISPVIAMDFVKDKFVEGVQNFWNYTKKQYNLFWKQITGQIEYAVNPFRSRTDEMNKKKIGVYLENLKPIPTSTFLEGMPVSVRGRIKAEVIENEISLSINCKSGDLEGELYPDKNKWQIVKKFDERIDCSFENLPQGSHTIEMSADVENFKTLSYLRSFFINEDTLFQLRRQGKDPFKVYNLKSSDFVTIRSPGPMEVAMDLGSPPIGVKLGEKVQLILSVGISNLWEGELKKIKQVYLIIPKGFEVIGITGLKSNKVVEKIKCNELPKEDVELCDDQIENAYEITQSALETLPKVLKNSAVVFSIKLQGNAENILQKQPYTNKYFNVVVVYDYTLKKKTTVFVKKKT